MVVRIVAVILVLVGAAGFFLPFWAASDGEYPLAEVNDIAVSDDHELFFALIHSGRIQKYSAEGEFIRGFKVDSAGGLFCLEIISDELFVHVARRDAIEVYNLDGYSRRRLVSVNENDFSEACKLDRRIQSVDYQLSQVQVVLEGVDTPTIIKRKALHFFAFGPFYSWLMAIVGLFLIPEWREGVFAQLRRKDEKKVSVKPTGIFLRAIDIFLDCLLTLYMLIFTTIGLAAVNFSLTSGDSEIDIFILVLGSIFVFFSLFGIFKIWTTNEAPVQYWPLTNNEMGPAGFVASKAASVLLFVAFIFVVFFFGVKSDSETERYDPFSEIEERSDPL